MITGFDRAKTGHGGGGAVARQEQRLVRLSCGCETRRLPELGNPDRWWCHGAWRRRRRAA